MTSLAGSVRPAPALAPETPGAETVLGTAHAEPLRVALFTETYLPRVDGIVNTLTWALRGLRAAGVEVLVVAPAGNTDAFLDVPVVGAPSVPFPLYPEVRAAFAGPGTLRRVDEFRPHLVHLAGPTLLGYSGLRHAKSRSLPVLATYHTSLPGYTRRYGAGVLEGPAWAVLRHMHNSCDVNLAPSTPVMTELGRHGFRRLRLWARGVDGALFHPSRRSTDVRRALGAQGDEPLLLYVGRLAKEKQIDDLRPVLQQFSSARLAIVGDGPERGPLEAAFSGLRVTFTGTLRGIQLAEAYASADVFCFPSPSETFGNVVLEAMASGLPVVAPASGGVLDLVRPGVTGALYAPGDLQDLVQAVAPLLHPEGPSRRYGAAGRAEAEQRTWRAQVQRLLWHYRAVLRLHRVSRRVLIPNEVAMS